jgi:hypothetical protein
MFLMMVYRDLKSPCVLRELQTSGLGQDNNIYFALLRVAAMVWDVAR